MLIIAINLKIFCFWLSIFNLWVELIWFSTFFLLPRINDFQDFIYWNPEELQDVQLRQEFGIPRSHYIVLSLKMYEIFPSYLIIYRRMQWTFLYNRKCPLAEHFLFPSVFLSTWSFKIEWYFTKSSFVNHSRCQKGSWGLTRFYSILTNFHRLWKTAPQLLIFFCHPWVHFW